MRDTAHGKGGRTDGAAKLFKAAFAVRGKAGRLQGAVGVYADQLDAVAVL